MFENYYAVIMAGGGGTRLWPLSRQNRPKQMLSLGSDRTLFQVAVDRLGGLFPADRILVVTVENQAGVLREQTPEIPEENFLLEPMPRGTASVVGLAAAALSVRDPNAVMAVLTADHIIGNLKLFQAILRSAYQAAGEKYLVTLGIRPLFPATGYGYIHRGELIGEFQEQEVFQVLNFTEKPQLEEAERMLASGEYVWNSGMFIWRADTILAEISRQMPGLADQLDQIRKTWGSTDRDLVIRKVWPEIKPQTVDFGIMEGAERVAVIPAAGLEWNDVGSWEALFEVLPNDGDGNIIQDVDHLGLDTTGSIVFGTHQPRKVVTIGARDLIVVDTGDVLLICRRDQAQQVRQVVKLLKDKGQADLI